MTTTATTATLAAILLEQHVHAGKTGYTLAVYRVLKDEKVYNFSPPLIVSDFFSPESLPNRFHKIKPGSVVVMRHGKRDTLIFSHKRRNTFTTHAFEKLSARERERTDETHDFASFISSWTDVSSFPDSAVFFSEDRVVDEHTLDVVNRMAAEDHVRKHGGTLLSQTTAGQVLRALDIHEDIYHSDKYLRCHFDYLEKRFAEAAAGNVIVFAQNASPQSRFCRVVLPAIMKNPKIQTINGKPKNKYAEAFRS